MAPLWEICLLCCERGDVDGVKRCVNLGLDISEMERSDSALSYAYIIGCVPLIRYLESQGVFVTEDNALKMLLAACRSGKLALFDEVYRYYSEPHDITVAYPIVQYGAIRDACRSGSVELVRRLRGIGLEPSLGAGGPYKEACLSGNIALVEMFLVELGREPDLDCDLWYIAEGGNVELMEYYCEYVDGCLEKMRKYRMWILNRSGVSRWKPRDGQVHHRKTRRAR